MAIITVDYLDSLVPGGLSDDDYDLAEILIDDVQREMESILNRSVELQTFTDEQAYVSLSPNNPGLTSSFGGIAPYQYVYVKNPPVRAVSEVKINDVVISPQTFQAQPWGFIYFGVGIEYLNATSANLWAYPINTFKVTYDGGLDGTNNGTLKLVLARAVQREITAQKEGDMGRAGYTDVKVEDFSWRKSEQVVTGNYPVRGGSGKGATAPTMPIGPFLPADLRLIYQYKRRTIVS